ncbi:hypothetical protein [Pyxidicoccus caerfyrddinensis]|uniref:hypothetical protein n=1 Tax=Pyxidicoccus caerfyrddinensis TaxID=2709663 RepID=UPI0013DC8442|nr:hypothetical protein [Pyxidicoccus caerfyrddinensis]
MKAMDVMTGWSTVRASVLVLAVLLGGMTEAQAQTQNPALKVTTPPVAGAAHDTVVASLVDAGIMTGDTVMVTLRLVDAAGAVVAQTSGLVSESMPLRLSYRATSAGGLSAQVLVPLTEVGLSLPLLSVERWSPAVWPPPREPQPEACLMPRTQRPPPTEGPVTLCLQVDPRCPCGAVPAGPT